MSSISEIMEDLLHLPRTERSYPDKKLIESLEEEKSLSEEERQVLAHRSQEIRNGSLNPLTLDQLKANVSTKLG